MTTSLNGLLGVDPVLATAGASMFADALRDQAVAVTETDWRPPLEGTAAHLTTVVELRPVGSGFPRNVSYCLTRARVRSVREMRSRRSPSATLSRSSARSRSGSCGVTVSRTRPRAGTTTLSSTIR